MAQQPEGEELPPDGSEHRGEEAGLLPEARKASGIRLSGRGQGLGGGVSLSGSPGALTPPGPTPLLPSPFLPPLEKPRGSLSPQRPSQQPRFSPRAWQVLGLEARLTRPAPEVQSGLERVCGGDWSLKAHPHPSRGGRNASF